MHTPFETTRLRLRRANIADAPFLRRLMNGEGWLRWIGDRGVHTLADARCHARERLVQAHEREGFSLLVVEARATGSRLGLCGLIRRDGLDDVDLGYAFSTEHEGRGFAGEAAEAVLERAHREHGLTRVVAITLADNARSTALLERLGFRFERTLEEEESGDALELYGSTHALGAVPIAGVACGALAAEADREGYRFLARLRDEAARGEAHFDAPGESLVGAWHGAELIGLCALHADPYLSRTRGAEPAIARLRHLYVSPAHRRDGLGTRLARRCLDGAADRFALVRLRAANAAAARFHARLGFEAVDEPDATHRLVLGSGR